MATSRKISTTELDFDKIKQNFKTYLQGQEQFSDYDFEGSSLSILLDVLAYNTHYNALYTNLAINEAFLDSASKRDSVVSKAKEIGYTPRSAQSATAVVDLLLINNQIDAPQSYELPRYTPFRTKVNDTEYVFFTTETFIAYRDNNQYVFGGITLREGVQATHRYTASASNTSFLIPNPGVDTSTIRVTVQESLQSSTSKTYTLSSSLLNLDGDSTVFFIKETAGELFQVEFGNGIVGKALEPGNVVTVEYIISSADAPNGARTFTYNGAFASSTTYYTTTVTPAFGGAASESVESIKWNAPRAYAAQNRCVTLDDYRSIIYSLYPNAQSINVWGGEQNNPPSYGDVYIAVRPSAGEVLSDGEKEYILNDVIGPRKMVTMHPKFVDPTYLYVELDVSFYYNPNETVRSANDLTATVRNAIIQYGQNNLDKFGGILKYSTLSREIDLAEDSIKSSITTVKIHREITPIYNQTAQYIVDIGNPIYNSGVPEESIISSGFNVINIPQTVYLDDMPVEGRDNGTMRLYYMVGNEKIIVREVGTVVYSKGIVTLNGLVVTGLTDSTFKLIIKPQSNDVVSTRNQIVSIAPNFLTIRPVIDTAADQYSFTSSRN